LTRFDVHVVPKSARPGPSGMHGGLPRLRVRAAPTDGAANAEAERTLRSAISGDVRLVAGARSRRKTFETELDADVLAERLRIAFGDVRHT